MTDLDRVRNRLLAVIAALLTVAALRASYAITMPLTAAAVVIASIWPIKPWLDRVLPSKLSYVGTVLVLLVVSCAFLGAIYFSASQVVRAFANSQPEFNRFLTAVSDWASDIGLQNLGSAEGYRQLIDIGQMVLANVYTVLVYLGFIAIVVILGLPEVPAMRDRLHCALTSAQRKELIAAVDEIADKIRQYLAVTALSSVITGVACSLWAFAVGLDLVLVWGVLNFLLNFIPVLGNIVGILPPTLYAIIQFQSPGMCLLVFAGFAVLQIVISNFVYPLMQGSRLALSPVVIVVALSFWSWVWGIAGALLAIPVTAALVIVCEHFQSTEWIARMLSSRPERG